MNTITITRQYQLISYFIRNALQNMPALWSKVPLAETLDSWLDTDMAPHVQFRGKRGNKYNKEEGHDPGSAQIASLYHDLELETELTCHVQQSMEFTDELAVSEVVMDKDLEMTCAVLTHAMGTLELGNKTRKRPQTCPPESKLNAEPAGSPSMSCNSH